MLVVSIVVTAWGKTYVPELYAIKREIATNSCDSFKRSRVAMSFLISFVRTSYFHGFYIDFLTKD